VRPAYSVLGHGRWAEAGIPVLEDWRTMLAGSGMFAD
jgi:dTDP-4-dehydrorhamnose reductase